MKQFVLILFSIALANSCEKKLKPIPDIYYEDLLNEIIPHKKIEYWEYRNYDYLESTTEIIIEKGDNYNSLNIPYLELKSSFREGCHPTMCFDYIVAIEDGKCVYIDEISEVSEFIGEINNIAEALILKYIVAPELYSISEDGEQVGMYYINKKEVNFILLKDESVCPKIIGQYLLTINRTTHEITSSRIKTYYQEKI
ncbi:hypothetical protein [Marinifilum caeruleilacunae]|uniref:Uncharacterized protein n=1 Tax=Marinifilum caeruleilacunae TaxID=2499076 RepID=A0ABX1X1Q6_9BACT|nr:hypothetical protein [Marinifilum caeruleilacunae]NOU62354.1 hypothetical protein [Marinifilum caeruleilacunae]